jgi:SAM-dependent methyltransferase
MANPIGLLRYLWRNKLGHCPVCGKATVFLLTQKPELIRNHAVCIRCRSNSRNRQLALCILDAFQGRGIGGLSDFAAHSDIRILNTSTTTPIAKALGTGSNIHCSEFLDGIAPGARNSAGILNQDLTQLTFPDMSLDLVLTEDVFEHVPDIKLGFREVFRVLKKGGLHIFTIPFYFDRPTRELFQWRDGRPILEEPIEYHGDPVRGEIPCFTHIGYDVIAYLRELGFAVRIERTSFAEQERYGTFDCYTFVTTKL